MNSCDSCAYQYDDLPRAELPRTIRRLAADLAVRLHAETPGTLRRRPAPSVWSGLEYACHVRDVLAVQNDRLQLALTEETPDFTPMDRDGRVEREGYNEQEPAVVAEQLQNAARAYADRLDAIDDAQWLRAGVYHWPETTTRSMDWVARHAIHELIHHLRDIDQSLDARD